jgi:hypothetical protein
MPAIAVPSTNREAVAESIRKYILACMPGKVLSVTVEEFKKERSSQQNRALFGHAYKTIAAATGLSGKDELNGLHEDFCKAFFGTKTITVLGSRRVVPVRTTTRNEEGKPDTISAAEFSQFYADVERKAAEFGIYIPSPDPRWFLSNERWSEVA